VLSGAIIAPKPHLKVTDQTDYDPSQPTCIWPISIQTVHTTNLPEFTPGETQPSSQSTEKSGQSAATLPIVPHPDADFQIADARWPPSIVGSDLNCGPDSSGHACPEAVQACQLRDGVAVPKTDCFLELDERFCSQPGRLERIARNRAIFGGWVRKVWLPVAARPDHKVVGPPTCPHALRIIVNGVPSHFEFMPLSPVSIRRKPRAGAQRPLSVVPQVVTIKGVLVGDGNGGNPHCLGPTGRKECRR